MNFRTPPKANWFFLLLIATIACAGVIAYCMYSNGSRKSGLEETAALSYASGISPIEVRTLKKTGDSYVHVKFRFRAEVLSGKSTLFQTASFNKGVSVELEGRVASVFVPDTLVPGGMKGFTLSSSIEPEQWHTVELEALNQSFVKATLDGEQAVDYASPGVSIEMSKLMIGGSSNVSLAFKGTIENVLITKGNSAPPGSSYFSTISNKAVLAFSIVTFLFLLLVKNIAGGFFKLVFSLAKNSNLTSVTLVLLQLALIGEIPQYRSVIFVYALLFVTGVCPYIFVVPKFAKEKFSVFVYAPLSGLLLLSLLGSYFIGFSIDLSYLVPVLLAMSLAGLALVWISRREEVCSAGREIGRNSATGMLVFSFLLTPVILLLIWPVLKPGFPTSVYRIGPDMASYAKMAQYLLDGGTWAEAGKRANEFAGMTPGEINRYSDATMSWPFMYHFRWALTAFQVVVAKLSFSKHAFETVFVSMAVPYLLMCGVIGIWLKRYMKLGLFAASLGAIVFAFNPNLLNLWYEGFYGNIYALEFFIPIMYVFVHFRSTMPGQVGRVETIKAVVFLSVLFAASLFSYAEGVMFVLAAFMLFMLFVDIVTNRAICPKPYLMILMGACFGLIIVFPCGFITEWAVLAIKQLTQEGGNGYAQPLWALPSEILGFQNIYLNTSVDLTGVILRRTFSSLLCPAFFSLLVICVGLAYLRRNRGGGNVLYLASVAMVAISAGVIFYKSPANNYTYMKMYVFHLPFLFVLFWGGLGAMLKTHWPAAPELVSRWLYLLIAMPVLASGVAYVYQYRTSAVGIGQSRIELHEAAKKIDFEHVILYPSFIARGNPGKDILYRDMYPAILPVPWMISSLWDSSHWKDKPYYKYFINHRVYLFIEKQSGRSYDFHPSRVVFQNADYAIVDSGRVVGDGVDVGRDIVDFDVYSRAIRQ